MTRNSDRTDYELSWALEALEGWSPNQSALNLECRPEMWLPEQSKQRVLSAPLYSAFLTSYVLRPIPTWRGGQGGPPQHWHTQLTLHTSEQPCSLSPEHYILSPGPHA